MHDTVIGDVMPDWSFTAWLRSQVVALGVTLGGVLWYAPIAAYLLLLSTWAKNKVFLWAVLPPIALPVLEKVFLGTSHIGRVHRAPIRRVHRRDAPGPECIRGRQQRSTAGGQ